MTKSGSRSTVNAKRISSSVWAYPGFVDRLVLGQATAA